MTFRPADWAAAIAAGLSAPGCIQMFLTPVLIASSTMCSVTGGEVMIERDSTGVGISEIEG